MGPQAPNPVYFTGDTLYIALMPRPFLKMNGLGNDFIVVDARETAFQPAPDQIRAWSNRVSGIGFDQLIAIEGSRDGDAFMRVWNSDGGGVETCGNALRCVAWYLNPNAADKTLKIDTLGGPTKARVLRADRHLPRHAPMMNLHERNGADRPRRPDHRDGHLVRDVEHVEQHRFTRF